MAIEGTILLVNADNELERRLVHIPKDITEHALASTVDGFAELYDTASVHMYHCQYVCTAAIRAANEDEKPLERIVSYKRKDIQ